jgi:cell division transport system permease protein
MSGSYDRPTGRPPYQAANPASQFEPYDDMVTGPATGPPIGHGEPRQPAPRVHQDVMRGHETVAQGSYPDPRMAPALQHDLTIDPPVERTAVRREVYAPARGGEAERGHAPIVPAGSVTGRSLTLVISIMCFLACLTAGAVYMMTQSAEAWMKDIASEVTVQVEPRSGVDTEATIKSVVAFLGKQSGIRNVRILSLDESGKLLEPWLGQTDALSQLPVPRLIALELDRSSPPDLEAMRGEMGRQYKAVTLDDHRLWQKQIRTVTRSFALGGLAILLLVGAATTAIIVSATRSALVSNREIVEVLHFVGATDRFIAREFERHFLQLGIRAGLVGALSAMVMFFALPTALDLLGGGTMTLAELHRLVGVGALDPAGYVLLGIVVVVIAALCMLTSRFGVYRILNTKH